MEKACTGNLMELNTEVISEKVSFEAMVYWSSQMGRNTKEISMTANPMAMEFCREQMVRYIEASLEMVNLMVRVLLRCLQVKGLKETLSMERNTDHSRYTTKMGSVDRLII